jgi:hypothetical protein
MQSQVLNNIIPSMKMPSSDFPNAKIRRAQVKKESVKTWNMQRFQARALISSRARTGHLAPLMQRNAQMHRQEIRRIMDKKKIVEKSKTK